MGDSRRVRAEQHRFCMVQSTRQSFLPSGTCMLHRWIGRTAAQRFRAEQASALWPAAFSCLLAWHVLSGAFRGRGVDRHMLLAGSHTRKDAQESQAPARLTCVCAALNRLVAVVLFVRKEGVTSF